MLVGVDGFEIGSDGPNVIVVGVDGSPTSLHAGAYAAGLARRQHSRIVAVYAISPSVLAGMAPSASAALEDSLVEDARDMAAQVADGAARVGVEVEFRAVRGDPVTEITRLADELRADAVVVGASTAAGHRLIGSIAVRLVKAGRWPVTVVP